MVGPAGTVDVELGSAPAVLTPVAESVPELPSKQPDKVAATSSPRIIWRDILCKPLQVIGCDGRGIANFRDLGVTTARTNATTGNPAI